MFKFIFNSHAVNWLHKTKKKSQIEFPNLAYWKYRKSFFENLATGNGNRVSLIENEFLYFMGNIEK